jgi:hypothetical protein
LDFFLRQIFLVLEQNVDEVQVPTVVEILAFMLGFLIDLLAELGELVFSVEVWNEQVEEVGDCVANVCCFPRN